MKIFILMLIIGGMKITSPPQSAACPVPVFRYALEFWEADPYSIVIFYEGFLDPAEKELVDYLMAASRGGESKANIELRNVDTDGEMDDITRGYLNSVSSSELPWVVLRYPRVSGINKVIWSGRLNKTNVESIVTSPARESIAGRLVEDVTAVWVFLESGDRSKDRAALDILNNHLSRLEKTLVLPDLELWWNDSGKGSDDKMPLVKFEVVSISRDDPREAHLVNMLINTEDDLKRFESEPIVFPVYGRGIALWAIVGNGINEWNISEAAEFLTGPCSCQAKLLNPGVDLLIAMDWDNVVQNIADMSLSNPLSGMGDFGSREAEVKSRLEAATNERLGKTGVSDVKDAGRGRVVYLDLFGDRSENNRESNPDNQTEKEDPAMLTETRSDFSPGSDSYRSTETEPDTAANSGSGPMTLADADISGSGPDSLSENVTSDSGRDFKNTIAYVFAGVIGLIFLGGIVLYHRNIS